MTAVLFDFNGVIVDDEHLHFEAFRVVLGERGIELGRDCYDRELLGFDDAGLFRAVLPGVQGPDLAALIARKAGVYADESARSLRLFPGVTALVTGLVAEGISLGVVSGALRHEIHDALARFDLAAAFRFVVAAEDVTRCKPDPEGYRLGFTRLAALGAVRTPADCVVIEDSPPGIAAARAAGMRAIAVAHTLPRAQLAADLVVETLADLTPHAVLRMGGCAA